MADNMVQTERDEKAMFFFVASDLHKAISTMGSENCGGEFELSSDRKAVVLKKHQLGLSVLACLEEPPPA